MSAPTLTTIAERLRARTAALAPADDEHGYAHALLAGALGCALDQVAQVFDPPDDIPPGAPLLDVDLCPDWALPWLAQIVGVAIPRGSTSDQARVLVRDVAGWKRGTPGAIRAAAGAFLTGGHTVYFNERESNNAYALGVLTLTYETPDPARTQAAIAAQVPAGIVVDYAAVAGQNYLAIRTALSSYNDVRDEYPNYDQLKVRLPD